MGIYIRLFTEALTDDKLIQVSPAARWLWVAGLLYAKQHMTDGMIPSGAIPFIGIGFADASESINDLLRIGLWELAQGGYTVTPGKWAKYQTTREEVEIKREESRMRVAKWREKKTAALHGVLHENEKTSQVQQRQQKCNANVTRYTKVQYANVTHPETETETEPYTEAKTEPEPINKNPLTPFQGEAPDGAGVPKKNAKRDVATEIPATLDTPEFRAAWNSWQQHRREKRQKLTPTSTSQQFKKMAAWGVSKAIAAIETSIANGWTGLFEPDAPVRQQSRPLSNILIQPEIKACQKCGQPPREGETLGRDFRTGVVLCYRCSGID